MALWSDYQWEKAIVQGAKGSGLPYSGKYQFANTFSYVAVQHEVAPKEEALTCGDCIWEEIASTGRPSAIPAIR
jgi:cytochrome c